MERHQPENLIVTNRVGSDGGESDGDGSENSDDPNDGSAGGLANRKGAGGGGSGSGGTGGGTVAFTREEVISNLVELFKEVNDSLHTHLDKASQQHTYCSIPTPPWLGTRPPIRVCSCEPFSMTHFGTD